MYASSQPFPILLVSIGGRVEAPGSKIQATEGLGMPDLTLI